MMYNPGTTASSTAPSALSVDGRQPVWMTLDEARERAFTGEIVFEVEPDVLAYFDNGVAYHAERVSDLSLAQRLLEAGVIDGAQLERGVVRVGAVEHLGRLFERDETIDRDAVLVTAEMWTEQLISELANREVASAQVTAYRHHPSGIHRWFASSRDEVVATPGSSVDDHDAGVLSADEWAALTNFDADDLVIEWDEAFDESESPFAVDEFVLDGEAEATSDDADQGVADFAIVWPDGTSMPTNVESPTIEDADTAPEIEAADDSSEAIEDADDSTENAAEVGDVAEIVVGEPSMLAAPTFAPPVSTELPVVTLEAPIGVGGAPVRFEMPALELRDEPDVQDGEVPDEVAEAVRRAIAAIESATSEVPIITADTVPSPEPAPALVEIVVNQPAPAFAFAPPTMDMRAEVIYSQLEAASAVAVADVQEPEVEVSPVESVEPMSAHDLALVPALADGGGHDERRSALRRLIGSLRRDR